MKELLKKIVKKECQRNTNERAFCIMQHECARAQLQYRGYDGKEAKRRANVLRATWNQVNDQNDLVKEVLEFLKDYPERGFRKEFLKDLDFIYGEDDQDWREMRAEDKARREAQQERKAAEKASKEESKSKRIKRQG